MKSMRTTLSPIGILGILLVGGCGATGEIEDPPVTAAGAPVPSGPVVPAPWTRRFMQPAVLVADRIVIEGPSDLVDHVAIRQEPDLFVYKTELTPAGLRQEIFRRPAVIGGEMRAQLDAWSLGALERLVVLQRPGDVPVIVRAEGNAVWIPTDGGEELRRQQLEFRGERP